MKNKRLFLLPATIAAGLHLLTPGLHAAAITWDAGGGANTNWSTPENWLPDDSDVTGDALTFGLGGATASGTTNTLSGDASIASLTYNQESATLQHTTAIAAGQALTVTGNFLLAGSTTTATTQTNVTLTGSTGTLTVGGTSFQAGQTAPGASGTTTNLLDMNGLGTFNANLGASGVFRLGATNGNQTGALATVKLAATSSITANEIGIGDKAGRSGTHTLKLGSTANTINANTISIGPGPVTGGRGAGDLSFETSTGTLMLRAADGASAVTTINLINSSFGTGNNLTATANFAGHSIDARIGTLTIARRNNTGTAALGAATFTFDTGTLEVGTVNMAVNAAPNSTSGAISATMNIGGGTASFNAITMATSSGLTGTTTTALLNLTGGTTTVNGNITRGGGTATTATVALKGGTLDMNAGNIGDATTPVTLTLESGTLENVAQINGGGVITKTTGGSLTLSGANTFTGNLTISAGEVKLTESGSLGTGPKTITVANLSSLTLDGTAGNIVLASDLSIRATGISILNLAGENVINGTVTTVTGNGTTTVTSDGGSLDLAGGINSAATNGRTLQLSGTSTGANTVSGAISNGTATFAVAKSGAGTWTITHASNAYTGATNVNQGTLAVSGTGSINSSSGVNINGGTFRYNSSTDISPAVTFTSGTVSGTNWNGTLSGLSVGTSQTISPGNSPGTAATGSQSWAAGGSYLWEINNATGTAGVDQGWDLLSGTGTLNMTASSGSEFNILVTSLTHANAAGLASNFNDATGYNWLIADFASIIGFGDTDFNLNTGGFTNPSTGNFGVSLGGGLLPGDNSQIYLTYTPIPEPRTALLGGLGLLALRCRRRSC